MPLPSIFTGLPGYDPETLDPEQPTPGALPPLTQAPRQPSTLEALIGQFQAESDLAHPYTRSLPGEAASSFLRGAIPGAVETTGQALRGVAAE